MSTPTAQPNYTGTGSIQITMDFNPVHQRENNAASQAKLEQNRMKFNGHCWFTLKRMLKGERLNVSDTSNRKDPATYISDLPRRAKDLMDKYGMPIRREYAVIEGVEQPWKEYYIAQEDRLTAYNKVVNMLRIQD